MNRLLQLASRLSVNAALFLLALIFEGLAAMPAYATIVHVNQSANASAGTTTITVSLSTTASNTVVVTVHVNWSIAGTLKCTDTPNGSYSHGTMRTNGGNSVQVFYVLSGAGGSLSIVCTSATGTLNHIYAQARQYSSNGLTLDGEAGFSATSTASPTSSNFTTATGANDLLIGAMVDYNASSGGITGSWGNEGKNTNQATIVCESEDQLNAATGTYDAQFTLGASESDWAACIVAFKEGGGGGGCTPSLALLGAGKCG